MSKVDLSKLPVKMTATGSVVLAIDRVRPHPENPNNGDIEAIGESLTEHGQYKPVLVQKSTGYILTGNHTYMALMELNSPVILAEVIDVDDDQATAIMIGDNEIAARRRPDHARMAKMLEDLRERRSLRGTGHTEETLAELVAKVRRESHAELQPEVEHCEACGQRLRRKAS